jgi:ABC-type ATPase involved in cell division
MIHERSEACVLEMVGFDLQHPRGGWIVHGANLTVAPGEVVVIVGAAGAGTSRLVAAALGEETASAGKVEVLGHDVGRLRRSSLRLLRRRVGIVPQDLCLLDDRSARDNVCVPLDIDGIPRAVSVARALEVLGYLGLADEALAPVAELAWSARQRVAVARALIREPDLIIADHPTSMQDAAGAELVCEALAGAARRGAACIVLGRDPALLSIAERERWRMLGLIAGALGPLGDVAGEPARLDSVLDEDSAPTDNIVPFPMLGAAGGAA